MITMHIGWYKPTWYSVRIYIYITSTLLGGCVWT